MSCHRICGYRRFLKDFHENSANNDYADLYREDAVADNYIADGIREHYQNDCDCGSFRDYPVASRTYNWDTFGADEINYRSSYNLLVDKNLYRMSRLQPLKHVYTSDYDKLFSLVLTLKPRMIMCGDNYVTDDIAVSMYRDILTEGNESGGVSMEILKALKCGKSISFRYDDNPDSVIAIFM